MSDNGLEPKLGRNASTMCKLLRISAPIIGSGGCGAQKAPVGFSLIQLHIPLS